MFLCVPARKYEMDRNATLKKVKIYYFNNSISAKCFIDFNINFVKSIKEDYYNIDFMLTLTQ